MRRLPIFADNALYKVDLRRPDDRSDPLSECPTILELECAPVYTAALLRPILQPVTGSLSCQTDILFRESLENRAEDPKTKCGRQAQRIRSMRTSRSISPC